MNYTIGEIAEKMEMTTHTLRYYDKEGLLPFVERTSGGGRVFAETDIQWLQVIQCLKATGMPIKDIRTYIQWCQQGDDTLEQRYAMFLERKAVVEKQLEEIQKTLDMVNYKCEYYEKAMAQGQQVSHFCSGRK